MEIITKMNEYDYSQIELLRLQTATQLTTVFINKSRAITQEELRKIIDDAFIATEYLLEKCKTPQDRKVRVPEGQNIYLIDGSFYYEYTNQEGNQVRTKLGE